MGVGLAMRMTPTDLEKLEALYADAMPEAVDNVYYAFPAMAAALREAWALCAEYDRERAEWIATADRFKADICTLMKERDEARADVHRLKRALDTARQRLNNMDSGEDVYWVES